MLATGALFVPSARAAERFGVSEANFEAGTCVTDVPGTRATECTYESPHSQFYTQAAGHPAFGITAFEFNSTETLGIKDPIGAVKNVRVDIPPGLAADPQALPQCTVEAFEEENGETCSSATQVGVDEATVYEGVNLTITGQVYDLKQPPGVPLEFGIHLAVPPLVNEHILLVGHVSWHHEPQMEAAGVTTGDFHEYFEIDNVPHNTPLLKSRLKFEGTKGTFLTLPSECSSTTTSHLRVESYSHAEDPSLPEGTVSETSETFTHTPVGVEHCAEHTVPFEPSVTVTPESAQSDEPDGATIEVQLPQTSDPASIDSSDLRYARVTLPTGMTLNPAAANGLEGCTSSQFARGTAEPVRCPAGSSIGTAEIATPDLPEPLAGDIYLGAPEAGATPESGGQYRIFINAESSYGVTVRVEGRVSASASTGQLTTALLEIPQLPFTDFVVRLNGGARAPLANPLACGSATTISVLAPFSSPSEPATPSSSFGVTGCASPLPFDLEQSAQAEPTSAGVNSTFTLSLARAGGQQYLSKVQTTLPEGLLGSIASVPRLCEEAQASAGTCPAESQIGVVNAAVGAGPEPFHLPTGPVYLTGPYGGAPYGLSIAVPAEHVGPYDFGRVITRATISIDPRTARVTTVASPPLLIGGTPVRLRALSITLNRPNFLVNPTSCGGLETESLLIGTPTLPPVVSGTQAISTPFPVSGCSSLAFAPDVSVKTSNKASRASGASLEVALTPHAHQANISEVGVTLPAQLVSRLTTLQKACSEAQFAAGPSGCPGASQVGTETLMTPLLPGVLSGRAYLVSHGGAAFPDLDFVLQGDGVTLIQESHTQIKNGITSSTFPALPDAPFTSFKASFPMGPNSLLAANGNLCTSTVTTRKREVVRKHGHAVRKHGHLVYRTRKVMRTVARKLMMPTTLLAQNGVRRTQTTQISVVGCAKSAVRSARILRPRVRMRGHAIQITLAVPAAGRITASGEDVRSVHMSVRKARTLTMTVPLAGAGLAALRAHKQLRVRVHLAFTPRRSGGEKLAAVASAVLRR